MGVNSERMRALSRHIHYDRSQFLFSYVVTTSVRPFVAASTGWGDATARVLLLSPRATHLAPRPNRNKVCAVRTEPERRISRYLRIKLIRYNIRSTNFEKPIPMIDRVI